MSITVISLSNPIEELGEIIINWNELPELVKKELLKGDYFMIRNSQSLCIYQDRRCIIDCMILTDLEGVEIELLNAYSKEGRIF